MSLFGTDGVRGVANVELTPDLALRLGRAAGLWLRGLTSAEAAREGESRRVVIGRDTRRSGPMLGASLAAGLCSAGVDVAALGVAPTPAVSFASRTGDFELGAVVSGSHNPAQDNGIKFLRHDGRKLSDEAEAAIEAVLDSDGCGAGPDVGRLSQESGPLGAYIEWLGEQLPERLDGFRVALDCANGAAYQLAPELLRRLGAEVVCIGCEPDGDNINLGCGATNPALIQQLTVETNAALGVSFDGDADRCIFSDEEGRLLNGDRMMGIWAAFWQSRSELQPPLVVSTVMSNLAFERALGELGIRLERTNVGDRYVAERMAQTGAKIGGEQSGHIIFADLTPTGDGLLTALQMLRVMRKSGCAASELPPVFDNWPQLLVNVRVQSRDGWESANGVRQAVEQARYELGDDGRVVVRASGTQTMIRVMVEARESSRRDEVAAAVLSAIERELGGEVQSRVDLTNALGD